MQERGPWQTEPDTSVTGPTQPVNPDTLEVSVSFVKADLPNVLAFLSMASGVPIVVDGDVKGTVTITSMNKVPLTMAYEVINSALRVRGYTMVGTLKDSVIRVVPLKRALAERPAVKEGVDASTIGTSDTVITQVMPLQYISATKLRDEIKPLVPDDQGNLLAVSSTNTLIVTDTEANVKRLAQIVTLLDKDTSDVISLEVYQCKYSSSTNLIASLSQALGLVNGASVTPQQQQSQPQGPQQPQGGRQFGRGAQPNAQPAATTSDDTGGLISLQGELHLASDDRTNSIIISASKQKIAMVLDLVKKLDVDTTPEVSARVFQLKYADATMVTSQLTALFQQPQGSSTTGNNNPFLQRLGLTTTPTDDKAYAGLKRNMIVADLRTNSVVVTATQQNMEQFEAVIKQLDTQDSLNEVARTYPLKYAVASTLATSLTTLFNGNTQSNIGRNVNISSTATAYNGDPISSLRNITVVAETKTNSLMITAPPQAFPMIENMLTQLDRRTDQVFIEVAVVDVALTDETKYGVEWNYGNSNYVNGSTSTTTSTTGTSTNGTSTTTTTTNPNSTKDGSVAGSASQNFGLNQLFQQGGGLKYSILNNNLSALLYGLGTKSNVKVYSTPTITTANGVAGLITIGENYPYVSSVATTGDTVQTTTAFVPIAIALTVTPHVNVASNLIGLDVDQTINELNGLVTNVDGSTSPIVGNREAKTSVMVTDGQTIVIGGMIQDDISKANNSVPFLSNIPLLGELFKSHDNTKQRSELMVFLTPHILRTDQLIDDSTKAAQHMISDQDNVLKPQAKQDVVDKKATEQK